LKTKKTSKAIALTSEFVKDGCFIGREVPKDHRKGLCICDLCIDQLEAWCDGREGRVLTRSVKVHLSIGHNWDWIKELRKRQNEKLYLNLIEEAGPSSVFH